MAREPDRYPVPIVGDPDDGGAYVSFTYTPPASDTSLTWYLPDPKILDVTAPTDPVTEKGEVGIVAAQPGDPQTYVFGYTLVTPKILSLVVRDTGDADSDSPQLYVDYFISRGECQEIVDVYRNNRFIGRPAGSTTLPNEYYLGTSSQAASPLMTSALGAYDTLDNICHAVMRHNQWNTFDVKFLIKGIKTFDPRTSPQAFTYSNNPALCLAHVFTESGYQVDWDSVGTAATYCDEDVEGSARWTLDLPIQNRRTLAQWVHTLAQYAGVLVDVRGGTVYFHVDGVVTSSPIISHTVTQDDIQNPRTTKVGTRQVPEKVIVHYREREGKNRTASVGSGTTGETSRLRMPGFSTYTMAARYGTQVRNKAQADLRHEHSAYDKAIEPLTGELADITYPPHGLSSKRMRLIGYRQTEIGRWARQYVEYDAALYNDLVFVAPDVNDTDLDNPNVVPDGPTPALTEELHTNGATRIKVVFSGVAWAHVLDYKISVVGEQSVLEGYYGDASGGPFTVYTAALKQDVNYLASIWVRSTSGALSEVPGTATLLSGSTTLQIGDVPWMNASEVGGLIFAEWGQVVFIAGEFVGYTLKLLADGHYTATSADWTNVNVITIANRLDAEHVLRPGPASGTYWLGIVAVDADGNESLNPLWRQIIVTTDAWTTNTSNLDSDALVNMHAYTIDGDAKYVVTSLGESWADKFEATSPHTWPDVLTTSPLARWGGDIATDSSMTTAAWDYGSLKDGLWTFSTETVTLLGGTQGNFTLLADESSPISYTENSGASVQDTARYMKAKISTTDSPASLGDGLHIKLPIQVSASGSVLPQSGTVTIADTSPLVNPATVTFTTAYSSIPKVTVSAVGGTALIVVADAVTTTGFDLYIFDTSGAKTSGTANWDATT